MKWLLVILNLAAAGGVLWGDAIVCSIHRVHSYSTYVGLPKRGAFASNPEKSVPLQSGDPSRISQEEIQEYLKNIGGLDDTLPVVTYTAAALFLLNAIVLSVVWKKRPAASSPPH